MRIPLAAALCLAATASLAGDFRLYPGFVNRDAVVEMTTDKGLIVEIVLRCRRTGSGVVAGIVTYSKLEGLFCSSKMKCTPSAARAARETCG